MGKTLVTGGTGFIGSHVVRALAARGDELRLLARRSSNLDHLSDLEFDRTTGDIADRRAVRRAMDGVERVFHVAGRTSLQGSDAEDVFRVNVRGTRVVMEEALAAKVTRVVHTSSVAAVGTAKREGTADESTVFEIGHLGIAYVNSKHEAEMEVLRMAARGLPVVCVNPSFVFGPDDPTGTSNTLIRRYLLRRIPVYVEGALNIVDVRDVARGHLQADEKGEVGERYILGGRNFTLDRLFADIARISGVEPPAKLPALVVLRAVETAEALRLPAPTSAEEVRSAMQWWTYRSTRAKRELGFKARPHEETLEDAVHWQMEQLGDRVGAGRGAGAEDAALSAFGRLLTMGERVLR